MVCRQYSAHLYKQIVALTAVLLRGLDCRFKQLLFIEFKSRDCCLYENNHGCCAHENFQDYMYFKNTCTYKICKLDLNESSLRRIGKKNGLLFDNRGIIQLISRWLTQQARAVRGCIDSVSTSELLLFITVKSV